MEPMARYVHFRSSLLLVLLLAPSLSGAQGLFPDAHDQPPVGWCRDKAFRLSQSYPETLPGRDDASWRNIDFTQEPEKYMRAVLSYAYKENVANDWRVEKNKDRKWYHAPWLHWGDKGREFIRGLTRERTSRVYELSIVQNLEYQNWAVSLYNDRGGYVLGQVWENPAAPNPAAADFPLGTVTIKLLFTQATPELVPYLKDSPEWDAHILTAPDAAVRKIQTLRLLQIDIAVRDERADTWTGWVFGTFQYDANVSDLNPWNRVTPVALMWGNELTPPQFWINQDAPFVAYRRSLSQDIGWEGRPNGPVDSRKSSCISCHSTAQYPVFADMVPPESADKSPWFRNLKRGEAFAKIFDKRAQPLDYSLQLAAGIKNFFDWLAMIQGLGAGGPAQGVKLPENCQEPGTAGDGHGVAPQNFTATVQEQVHPYHDVTREGTTKPPELIPAHPVLSPP